MTRLLAWLLALYRAGRPFSFAGGGHGYDPAAAIVHRARRLDCRRGRR